MINGKIDLRSDTVTVPTEQMRQAMCTAVVGDDVYGDDATVNELEALAAEMMGKEAGLFVPSGVMSNQLALFTHVNRGQEVILPDNCHIVAHEAGAAAIIAGAQLRTVQNVNGEMPLDIVEKYIRKDPNDIHQPTTALITYENADSDGQVRSLEYMKRVRELADRYHLPAHGFLMPQRYWVWKPKRLRSMQIRYLSASPKGYARLWALFWLAARNSLHRQEESGKSLAAGCAKWGFWRQQAKLH